MDVDLASSHTYRTFWRRFWAGMIDGFVFLPLGWIDTWVWESVTIPAFLLPWFVFNSIAFITYTVLLHGLCGQTVGKRVAGVRVLDVSGAKLSMRQAALRDCVFLVLLAYGLVFDIPSVASGVNPYQYDPETFQLSDLGVARLLSLYAAMLWFLVELLTMLFNRKRRALHDFIAGSVVVRVD